MELINCKIKLKFKWTKYCVLPGGGADNNDGSSNSITFTQNIMFQLQRY